MDLKEFWEEQQRVAKDLERQLNETDLEKRFPLAEDDPVLSPLYKAEADCLEMLELVDQQDLVLLYKLRNTITIWDVNIGLALGKSEEELGKLVEQLPKPDSGTC